MKTKLNRWYIKFLNVWCKVFPYSHVFYAKREYGYSWQTLNKVWRESVPEPGKTFMGKPVGKPLEFFTALAGMQHDECDTYICVNGCCSIWWHPRRGNMGGGGPAGCSCDNMDDPRDLERGPL